jgi:tripartite-type tricarboxylate transporter receptor subunit TctC
VQYFSISGEIRIADGGRTVPIAEVCFGHDVDTGVIYQDANIKVTAVDRKWQHRHRGRRECAPADGHTLVLLAANNAISATLYEKLNFNLIRDIAPVASIIRVPNALQVHPSVPAKTVPEFIAYAKANPAKITTASAGIGSVAHLAGELFKMMAGVDMVHVPYRGSAPALTDLLGGQVQATFADVPSSIEYIKAGKLRALAVTTAARSEALPDIPVMRDFVPGYEASGWFGVGVPKNTPSAIIQRLNREINAALVDPKIKARLADLGGMMFPGSPADFERIIAGEVEKWGKAVKFSGARAE